MTDEVRIGVDVGGTFTDIVTIQDGELRVHKIPTTPSNAAEGMKRGVTDILSASDLAPEQVTFFGHGTTVATNAVLEKTWAKTVLITTEGFRDVLEIGRQNRPALYDLTAEKPPPIVPRHRRHTISERVDERGSVIDAIDPAEIEQVIDQIPEDVESVAICLLFSFENPSHERRLETKLTADRDLAVSLSSSVHPEIREFERTQTTALNAALMPVIRQYLDQVTTDLDERGVSTEMVLMGSNGGTMTPRTAKNRPVNTLLSGPAAGVKGAAFVAKQAGVANLITMDMGGTSCDVSMVKDGEPISTREATIGDYQLRKSMIDITTIGAGGGSIAWIDDGGALRVGPESAGAKPGPVCYGRGGSRPTLTDAHYLLGRIDPTAFGHGFTPEYDQVASIVKDTIADPLELSIDEAAQGIIDVAIANMERAIRVVTVERGYDPRRLSLLAFGGAGPLHGPRLASNLDIPSVVIPRSAGTLSALGLLASDVIHDFTRSRIRQWDQIDPAELESFFDELETEARNRLSREHFPTDRHRLDRSVNVRYLGQTYSLEVPAPETITDATLGEIAARFHDLHNDRYGHASPDEPIELVGLRLRAYGQVTPPALMAPKDQAAETGTQRNREVGFQEGRFETPIYSWDHLSPERQLSGPAIIEGEESTVAVPPHRELTVDESGSLIVEAS